ncbi:hypothetical protein MAR_003106, partial [Mya arenaria]
MAASKIKTQVKRTNNINSEVMFQRLLAVNAYKKVPTERVFAFENTPVPTSLFSEDGTMLKCKKSDFMTMLEGLLPDKITHIHKADTLIFDGMALVQSLSPQSEHLTFRYMAEMFMKHVFKKASNIANVKTVHIVFDRYSNISLKTQTRNGRAYAKKRGSDCIVVHSPDTDVLVLLLHHFAAIGVGKMYMSTGRTGIHTDSKRYIPIHDLFDMISEDQMNVMLSVYCLTGCDTTSSFYGKGKKKAFKLLMQSSSKYQPLSDMGEDASLTPLQKSACVTFVADLYGSSGCSTLNSIRSLWIWRHALIGIHHLPSPTQFGYETNPDNGTLQPVMMNQSVAAPELLNDMVCNCSLCSDDCSCFRNKQPCTGACGCGGSTSNESTDTICTNVFTLTSLIHEEDLD